MSEHHGIHESNSASEPSGAKMRKSIQHVNCREHEAQILLRKPEPSKEPIGNDGVRQETATKGVQRKQRSQFSNDSLRFRRNRSDLLKRGRSVDLNGGREH